MNVLEVATVLASSILVALFVLIIKVENPETALYQTTVEMLMQQEDLSSEQEVEERFPILREIKSKLNQIANMKQLMLRKTQSPSPILSEEESLQLKNYRQKIQQLRKVVRTDLLQLSETYAHSNP